MPILSRRTTSQPGRRVVCHGWRKAGGSVPVLLICRAPQPRRGDIYDRDLRVDAGRSTTAPRTEYPGAAAGALGMFSLSPSRQAPRIARRLWRLREVDGHRAGATERARESAKPLGSTRSLRYETPSPPPLCRCRVVVYTHAPGSPLPPGSCGTDAWANGSCRPPTDCSLGWRRRGGLQQIWLAGCTLVQYEQALTAHHSRPPGWLCALSIHPLFRTRNKLGLSLSTYTYIHIHPL